MKLEMTALRGLVEQFSDGRTEPPAQVVQALAALIGDAEVSASIAVHDLARASESSDETRTTWECMALAGDSVVSVSAARTGGDWYLDDFADEPASPTIYGSLIPLREVTACRVLNVRSFGDTAWVTRWQLDLRGSGALTIPWPQHKPGQERHEALAREVAKRLR